MGPTYLQGLAYQEAGKRTRGLGYIISIVAPNTFLLEQSCQFLYCPWRPGSLACRMGMHIFDLKNVSQFLEELVEQFMAQEMKNLVSNSLWLLANVRK